MSRVSVCMGVYNGEHYLEEQLACILQQTHAPEEVILCDDGSKDLSREKITEFIKKNHPGEGWRFLCNQENKGYPGIYYYVMGLCTGDYVFLADQDDIWDETKIEKMTALLDADPEKKAVCCKFGLIDKEGNSIHSVMEPTRSKNSGEVSAVTMEEFFYKYQWPGMVLAYRRKWFAEKYQRWQDKRGEEGTGDLSALPDEIPHDYLVCIWAAEENGLFRLDEELAWHRRHDHNAGGEEHRVYKLLKKERKLKEIEDYNRILRTLEGENLLETDSGKAILSQKHRVMEERFQALASGKSEKVIKNAWHNRHYTRIATAVCDIAIACSRSERQ